MEIFLRSCAFCLSLALVAACGGGTSLLDRIEQRGTLKVVTRSGPTTFYSDFDRQAGFEYSLAKEFADHLGVGLEMYQVYGRDDIYRHLERRQADLAAAGLIINPARLHQVRYSTAYLPATVRVIYRIGNKRPKQAEDLLHKRIAIPADSFYTSSLEKLKSSMPDLRWEDIYDLETIDLLEQIRRGELDYTLLNEMEFIAYRGIYPELAPGLQLGDTQKLAWAMARHYGDEAELYLQMDEFMQDMLQTGKLDELHDRYFGHAAEINQASALEFAANVKLKLPQYEKLIRTVATEYGMRWELLAAMSYQESHWNPDAVSPTGVLGMMMLTANTASDLNVQDRTDLEQSLRGGARYFLNIKKRIPEDVLEPDRTWFALAAYNVGLGHLEDARKITESQGSDPHKWMQVKQYLPLLRQAAWHENTRYGFARGDEPVLYVQNIRHYYDVLRQQHIAKQRSLPPMEVSHRASREFVRPMPAI